ncbi:MAG: hypothetical protein IT462_17655 [Planctomycetes bacterium]|nr:hypothetical protein [Planctomycetota bacterium]
MMRFAPLLFALLCVLATSLAANDVALPDGNGGVLMLLPEPTSAAGDGLSEFAGDPGLPCPAWSEWPGAAWPGCELWRLKDGKVERLTNVVGGGAEKDRTSNRRTLYAAFVAGGATYALHYDPFKEFGGICEVVRIDAAQAKADGVPVGGSVLLASAEYLDAPCVSPDGKYLCVRAFNKEAITLRVYDLATWKLAAESSVAVYARPVWIDNAALCVVAYETTLRDAMRAAASEPAPVVGKLLKLVMVDDKLASTELLAGTFPPDFYSRNLAWSTTQKKLIVARADKTGIAIELRDAAPDAKPLQVEHFDFARGVGVDGPAILCAGVERGRFCQTVTAANDAGSKPEGKRAVIESAGVDGRGGMIGLAGCVAIIEPVGNPLWATGRDAQPEVLHTLVITGPGGFDSLRNPRTLQRVSAVASRFKDIENYKWKGTTPRPLVSTVLAFDLNIDIDDKAIKNKKGRYIEYYDAKGRGGKGRLRWEDNLGGNWVVNAVSGKGTPETDKVYDNGLVGNAGELQETAATRSGTYDKLLEQIESRNALLLTGLERAPDKGGLKFVGRAIWRDPIDGVDKRVFTYARTITTSGGSKFNALLSFVADVPSMGNRANPHPLMRARMQTRFGGGNFGEVDLAFSTDSFVELPNLEIADAPKMLLPRTFSAYQTDKNGKAVRQFSATLLTTVNGDPKHLRGTLTCGYNESGASTDDKFNNLYRRKP